MFKKLLALLFGIALSLSVADASTVTGIPTSNGAVIPGGKVTFTLLGCANPLANSPTGLPAQSTYGPFSLSSTGLLNSTVLGNDSIYCQGQVKTTYYEIKTFDNGGYLVWDRYYQVTGLLWNIGTAVQYTNIAVTGAYILQNPSTNQNVLQPTNTSLSLEGITNLQYAYTTIAPTVGTQLANKAYVDSSISSAVSTFVLPPNEPESYIVNLIADLGSKLNISGGTMTGNLFLNADPTGALQAATKEYVDAATGSSIPSISGPSTPTASCTSTNTSQLYTDLGTNNIYTCDGTSWQLTSGSGGGGLPTGASLLVLATPTTGGGTYTPTLRALSAADLTPIGTITNNTSGHAATLAATVPCTAGTAPSGTQGVNYPANGITTAGASNCISDTVLPIGVQNYISNINGTLYTPAYNSLFLNCQGASPGAGCGAGILGATGGTALDNALTDCYNNFGTIILNNNFVPNGAFVLPCSIKSPVNYQLFTDPIIAGYGGGPPIPNDVFLSSYMKYYSFSLENDQLGVPSTVFFNPGLFPFTVTPPANYVHTGSNFSTPEMYYGFDFTQSPMTGDGGTLGGIKFESNVYAGGGNSSTSGGTNNVQQNLLTLSANKYVPTQGGGYLQMNLNSPATGDAFAINMSVQCGGISGGFDQGCGQFWGGLAENYNLFNFTSGHTTTGFIVTDVSLTSNVITVNLPSVANLTSGQTVVFSGLQNATFLNYTTPVTIASIGNLSATLTNVVLSSGTATFTTSAAHGFSPGQQVYVTVTGAHSALSGSYLLQTASGSTFTVSISGSLSSTAISGTATDTYFTANYTHANYAAALDAGVAQICWGSCGSSSWNYSFIPERPIISWTASSYDNSNNEAVGRYLADTTSPYSSQIETITVAKSVGLPGMQISNVALTSNVVTLTVDTSTNVAGGGSSVVIQGLQTATFLNGQALTVTAATSTSVTASFTHANYSSAADTGFATGVAGLIDEIQPNVSNPLFKITAWPDANWQSMFGTGIIMAMNQPMPNDNQTVYASTNGSFCQSGSSPTYIAGTKIGQVGGSFVAATARAYPVEKYCYQVNSSAGVKQGDKVVISDPYCAPEVSVVWSVPDSTHIVASASCARPSNATTIYDGPAVGLGIMFPVDAVNTTAQYWFPIVAADPLGNLYAWDATLKTGNGYVGYRGFKSMASDTAPTTGTVTSTGSGLGPYALSTVALSTPGHIGVEAGGTAHYPTPLIVTPTGTGVTCTTSPTAHYSLVWYGGYYRANGVVVDVPGSCTVSTGSVTFVVTNEFADPPNQAYLAPTTRVDQVASSYSQITNNTPSQKNLTHNAILAPRITVDPNPYMDGTFAATTFTGTTVAFANGNTAVESSWYRQYITGNSQLGMSQNTPDNSLRVLWDFGQNGQAPPTYVQITNNTPWYYFNLLPADLQDAAYTAAGFNTSQRAGFGSLGEGSGITFRAQLGTDFYQVNPPSNGAFYITCYSGPTNMNDSSPCTHSINSPWWLMAYNANTPGSPNTHEYGFQVDIANNALNIFGNGTDIGQIASTGLTITNLTITGVCTGCSGGGGGINATEFQGVTIGTGASGTKGYFYNGSTFALSYPDANLNPSKAAGNNGVMYTNVSGGMTEDATFTLDGSGNALATSLKFHSDSGKGITATSNTTTGDTIAVTEAAGAVAANTNCIQGDGHGGIASASAACGSGSGGAPTYVGHSFSATPTFGNTTSANYLEYMPLIGNVTSMTFTAPSSGTESVTIVLYDSAGSHTVAWASNVNGAPTVSLTAGKSISVTFDYVPGLSKWLARNMANE